MSRAALEGRNSALETCSIRDKQVADGDTRVRVGRECLERYPRGVGAVVRRTSDQPVQEAGGRRLHDQLLSRLVRVEEVAQRYELVDVGQSYGCGGADLPESHDGHDLLRCLFHSNFQI